MMRRFSITILAAAALLTATPSCNQNKITCPTYKDSFPDNPKKKKKPEPQIPKATKPKSGVMPR